MSHRKLGSTKNINGKITAEICLEGNRTYLGQFETEEEARIKINDVVWDNLKYQTEIYGLDINDSILYMGKYFVFKTGHIFNIRGKLMSVSINGQGREVVHLNGKTYYLRNIIKELFS